MKNGCNTNVRARLTLNNVNLPDCTPFEMALDLNSINIAKASLMKALCMRCAGKVFYFSLSSPSHRSIKVWALLWVAFRFARALIL